MKSKKAAQLGGKDKYASCRGVEGLFNTTGRGEKDVNCSVRICIGYR